MGFAAMEVEMMSYVASGGVYTTAERGGCVGCGIKITTTGVYQKAGSTRIILSDGDRGRALWPKRLFPTVLLG